MQDLIAAGIIDPAKVTRSGLTNACGIAGIMLTTQARTLVGFVARTVGGGLWCCSSAPEQETQLNRL